MKTTSQHKIVSNEAFISLIKEWKEKGQKVVFTNGCFDLIHAGHIDYLEKAGNFGDKLVVGLNTDRSVLELKGPGRPLNDQNARARILAALEFVDLITLFDEDTPHRLISQVVPDILVKGNDYADEDIVGAGIVKENGGEVLTVPLVAGYSTSELIRKITFVHK
ncbi:MAG: D-glycero-beta-D-manno-heptose 1-phosphate adenylyltransferase [Bacteroidetes bacterium]|nr:D-glycero-beta-D-manno-heptose 1-phosphate adenylyltransferase [Bacteroidota bacterium]